MRKRLGDRLLEAGAITRPQLDEALKTQTALGGQIGKALVELGYLDEKRLLRALCEDAGIRYLSPQELKPEPSAVSAVPEKVARTHTALPLRQENGRLLIAMADPFDISAVNALERATGRPIKVVATPRETITALLDQVYSQIIPDPATVKPARPRVEATAVPVSLPNINFQTDDFDENATVAQVADEVIQRGIALGATDIHVEPLETVTRVRYRLDGILHEGPTYPRTMQAPLMSRIKILSNLNIAETRLPQDGRFRIQSEKRDVDVRISTFPTLHGEDVVMRLLDRGRVELQLEALGIAPVDIELLRAAIRRPHGLIPVTGPTGSGKTTTLYSALGELNTGERCIITLEDPIEYELEGVRQSQINLRAGLTFASGLRSILRHDPDVILVGEMRDEETVQIGLSAALTGHMVLTTLHTNTAAGAIPRLLDMGSEPFLLASALQLVVSQRLVRSVCQKCKQPIDLPAPIREKYKLAGTMFGAVGCPACRMTGFRGRLGIFEFLPITEAVTQAIYDRRSADEIQRLAQRPTLFQDGLRKVRSGATTLDELLRVTVA
jgi:type IV pilus assembly protein PilB